MNSVKQVQFRRQNETLPRAEFLSVNQQQKTTKITTTKNYSKDRKGPNIKKTQQSTKGKYQGKFIYTDFFLSPGD